MKICFVAEGCYPYTVGGVSSWIHNMIRSFPDVEFVILAIIANRSQSGQFAYELGDNVTDVYEVYLEDLDYQVHKHSPHRTNLNQKQYEALRSLVFNHDVDWNTIFDLFQRENLSVDDLLMGADFFQITKELYEQEYPEIVFSDFLWTMRSIYLPLFLVLHTRIPKADLYHCVATGYAGVLGAMAKQMFGCGLLVSEHGIYTREREEEIIKADWVKGIYKDIWINQFRKMSQLAYDKSDAVTCLFAHARELQIELGCKEEKILITPNGIDENRFVSIPGKTEEDRNYFNIGAVLRVAPIKDVKTLLQSFAYAKKKCPNLKLWVMGPTGEEEQYAKECFDLVRYMSIPDVEFTGRINVTDYLGRMDCTILTSISEGQPLTILEGYAAHLPAIATDVGNCRGLLYGENDGIGASGILCHIMNVQEIAGAMVHMAEHREETKMMGENGYHRLMKKYTIEKMKRTYNEIYKWFAEKYNCSYREK